MKWVEAAAPAPSQAPEPAQQAPRPETRRFGLGLAYSKVDSAFVGGFGGFAAIRSSPVYVRGVLTFAPEPTQELLEAFEDYSWVQENQWWATQARGRAALYMLPFLRLGLASRYDNTMGFSKELSAAMEGGLLFVDNIVRAGPWLAVGKTLGNFDLGLSAAWLEPLFTFPPGYAEGMYTGVEKPMRHYFAADIPLSLEWVWYPKRWFIESRRQNRPAAA